MKNFAKDLGHRLILACAYFSFVRRHAASLAQCKGSICTLMGDLWRIHRGQNPCQKCSPLYTEVPAPLRTRFIPWEVVLLVTIYIAFKHHVARLKEMDPVLE